jgi:hypothetical protein
MLGRFELRNFFPEDHIQEELEWQQRYGPYTPNICRYKDTPILGKIKSADRQIALLKLDRIACHCEGGLAMDDPDLRKLIKKGYMKFIRIAYSKGWGGDYDICRTHAVTTDKGREFLTRV